MMVGCSLTGTEQIQTDFRALVRRPKRNRLPDSVVLSQRGLSMKRCTTLMAVAALVCLGGLATYVAAQNQQQVAPQAQIEIKAAPQVQVPPNGQPIPGGFGGPKG